MQSDIATWTTDIAHHKRAEIRCAVASFVAALLAMGAAEAALWMACGPLAFCAIVLGLFASHHNGRRRDLERSNLYRRLPAGRSR